MNSLRQELIRAREEYINLMRDELLGPGSEFSLPDREHELVSASPMTRYVVGILYPQGARTNLENDEIEREGDENTEQIAETEAEGELEKANLEEQLAIKEKKSEAKEEKGIDEGGAADADDGEGGNMDEEINMAAQYAPSSMGLTFITDEDLNELEGKIEFATYKKVKLANECMIRFKPKEGKDYKLPAEIGRFVEYDSDNEILKLLHKISKKEIWEKLKQAKLGEDENQLGNALYRLEEISRDGYMREPHEFKFQIAFRDGRYSEEAKNMEIDGTYLKVVALKTALKNGRFSFTVMAVNDKKLDQKERKGTENCIFQTKITIDNRGNNYRFLDNHGKAVDDETMDDEERSLELLYRNKRNYGYGLGVSVDWEIDENGMGKLWTEYIPRREIPPVDFGLPKNSKIRSEDLSMKYFSDLDESPKEEKIARLEALAELYQNWIIGLREIAQKLDPKYQTAAAKNIENCQEACDRMKAGIEKLVNSEKVFQAFQLANRAMFMQRVHLRMQANNKNEDGLPGNKKIAKEILEMDYYTEKDDVTAKCWWRPFQLAFILMDIVSIVDEESEDRKIVDLIWFPTGGGKTEAYLGLSAFVIFYQKLMHLEESYGTMIIMRYTLRLLTAQQFTRASTLICACEAIRRDSERRTPKYPRYNLGDKPITIGLWIGSAHVPNKIERAKELVDNLRGVSRASDLRYRKDENNKFQVLVCPWCGTKLTREVKDGKIVGKWGYSATSRHFCIHCTNDDCDFVEELPIQVIDEELYKKPPTLLFGTVDKFAMMPWIEESGAFFATRTNNRAPELIIQDELHLISGSLGTIVGLYETAIEGLCAIKGVMPKLVASTATIRRAKEQCGNLYGRRVMQFPAPGLDAEDSFFARELKIDHEKGVFGREYVGVMPSGKTKMTVEVKMVAAMLQRLYGMNFGKNDEAVKDQFWTTTVYFGSLRELGTLSATVEDSVMDFMRRTAKRMFARTRRLPIGAVTELTSRVSTTELNETLERLEKRGYVKDDKNYAIGLALATNMISVGIDVGRLNTMLVVGQPKVTSEYIQASSRVGREHPGVVFVEFDPTKSRDRSHYEDFRSYHDSLYRFVEPTGVTPFSRPARERALHAVAVMLFRQMAEKNFCKEDEAGKFSLEGNKEVVEKIEEFIRGRVTRINQFAGDATNIKAEKVVDEVQEFFEDWEKLKDQDDEEPVHYGYRDLNSKKKIKGYRRLLGTFEDRRKDALRRTMTSMRNVDKTAIGNIIIGEDNE